MQHCWQPEYCDPVWQIFSKLVSLYFDSIFVVYVFLEYLIDLQGRDVDDPGMYWEFFGSSVCGKETFPFLICVRVSSE